jgi:hypothetical protein
VRVDNETKTRIEIDIEMKGRERKDDRLKPLQPDFIRPKMLPHYPALSESGYAQPYGVLAHEPPERGDSPSQDHRKRGPTPDDQYHPALKPKQRRISQACIPCGRKKVKVSRLKPSGDPCCLFQYRPSQSHPSAMVRHRARPAATAMKPATTARSRSGTFPCLLRFICTHG